MSSSFELPAISYGYKGQNGRVNFADESSDTFLNEGIKTAFTHRTTVGKDTETSMLRGNWEKSSVSESFFSSKNIDTIQNGIRSEVYRKSADKKWIIDPQSVDELQIIMRGLYYQYAKNLPTNIEGQVAELNKIVYDWTIPKIMSEIQHYHFYINDISHMPVPLSHSQSMSSAGTKTLPMNPFM